MDVKLCCIDLSTQKTGIAYFKNGKYKEHFLLDYSKNKDTVARFKTMSQEIWNLLEKYKPMIVFIEDTYSGRNAQTMKILTRLQGVIYAWCMLNDGEFNTITPSQWRKHLDFTQSKGVKRQQLKEQSVKYILDRYKLEVNDDEADAICIGDAVLKMFSE